MRGQARYFLSVSVFIFSLISVNHSKCLIVLFYLINHDLIMIVYNVFITSIMKLRSQNMSVLGFVDPEILTGFCDHQLINGL